MLPTELLLKSFDYLNYCLPHGEIILRTRIGSLRCCYCFGRCSIL